MVLRGYRAASSKLHRTRSQKTAFGQAKTLRLKTAKKEEKNLLLECGRQRVGPSPCSRTNTTHAIARTKSRYIRLDPPQVPSKKLSAMTN